MAEIDGELVERVTRWCAEAGRQTGTSTIRAALAPLGWDELLAVKALLADPPPARPLGPHALVDVARGVPADVAAEREREGRYRSEPDDPAPAPADEPPREPKGTRRVSPRRRARAAFVIHRARDRAAPEPTPEENPRRPVEELFRPEGRSVLERLVRAGGARRAKLAAALAAGWRTSTGAPATPDDLAALLEEHGLARAFERRERDETLHAVRAAGGLLGATAERLGIDEAGLASALERLGIGPEVERIREERRRDLRARATLSERVKLLLEDGPRLRDLGLEPEFEADLRARLPEHVRALQGGAEPVPAALARTLSLPREAADALVTRLGLELPARGHAQPRPARPPEAPRSPGARATVPRRERPGQPGAAPRGGARRPGAARGPGGGGPGTPRDAAANALPGARKVTRPDSGPRRPGAPLAARAAPAAKRGPPGPRSRPSSGFRPPPSSGPASSSRPPANPRSSSPRPPSSSRPPAGRRPPGAPPGRGGAPARPARPGAPPRPGGPRPPRRPPR
jgi:hypothetical protein